MRPLLAIAFALVPCIGQVAMAAPDTSPPATATPDPSAPDSEQPTAPNRPADADGSAADEVQPTNAAAELERARRDRIIASLQTEVWEEPALTFNPLWELLALPESVVELAFTPVSFAVRGIERYRLDQRVYDLLRNDAGTIVLTPKLKISGGDGLGGGAKLELEELFGAEERFDFAGIARLNGDYELEAGFERSSPFLEGREVWIALAYELDQDVPYFGIGNDTAAENERVVSSRLLAGRVGTDLFELGRLDLFGRVEIGGLRHEITTGKDSSHPGYDPATDDFAAPAGFGETRDYLTARVSAGTDSRDTEALTTRGILSELALTGTSSFDREHRSLRVDLAVTAFVPLLPRNRVLVLAAGGGWVGPAGGDEVPFFDLVTLGRKNRLRGFSKGRFRDHFGWWSSAEYRWPIYEYQDTGVALTPTLFVDVGRVDSSPGGLIGDVHVDYGIGLRLAHESKFLVSSELGMSVEGPQFSFTLGKTL